jgi:hypothetical protein
MRPFCLTSLSSHPERRFHAASVLHERRSRPRSAPRMDTFDRTFCPRGRPDSQNDLHRALAETLGRKLRLRRLRPDQGVLDPKARAKLQVRVDY